MRKLKAKRDRYRSDVDFYDIVYDAEWRQSRFFGNRRDASWDNINRVNNERSKADPGVYVYGSVYKTPVKTYRKK